MTREELERSRDELIAEWNRVDRQFVARRRRGASARQLRQRRDAVDEKLRSVRAKIKALGPAPDELARIGARAANQGRGR